MSHFSSRSTSFTTKGEPSRPRSPPPFGPRRGSFTPQASTPPLEERPDHFRPAPPPSNQEMAPHKEPESSDSTLSYSDDQLTDADDDQDSDAGSQSGDGDSEVPLQQSRNSDGVHRDKCFTCWEAKQPCVRGSGRGCARCTIQGNRCNASRQVPQYKEPAILKLYKKIQAQLIRDSGGQWEPAPTDPRSWVTGEKTTEAFDAVFRKYGVVKPPYVRFEKGHMLMSKSKTAPLERERRSRPAKRQRCTTPGPPPRRAAVSRASVPPRRARSPTPEPPKQLRAPLQTRPIMLSQEDVDALVNPSQSISLALEDIEQEERRIEQLQEMIVPALKKKYAVLQALKALKQGAPSMDRWLPLLNYPAIDQFERGSSAAYGGSRSGPKQQHRLVDRLSEQGSDRNRRDSADSSSMTAFEAEPPWRRFRS